MDETKGNFLLDPAALLVEVVNDREIDVIRGVNPGTLLLPQSFSHDTQGVLSNPSSFLSSNYISSIFPTSPQCYDFCSQSFLASTHVSTQVCNKIVDCHKMLDDGGNGENIGGRTNIEGECNHNVSQESGLKAVKRMYIIVRNMGLKV